MALTIKITQYRKHGLEVFEVSVNGTILSTHLAKESAELKVKRCLIAWNQEKIGKNRKAS